MFKIDAHTHVGEGPMSWSGKQVVAQMDVLNVKKTVIFPFTEGFFNNDHILPCAREYPDRLIPFCAVNPWEKQKALDELERCFQSGFEGLKLHPQLNGFRLSDYKLCDSIFELAQQYNKPIIVHGASDLYNCPLEFERMGRRFPNVRLIMAHCGFFWEWELAAEIALEIENLYLETSRVPAFETARILEMIGPDKLIWGTDSPCADVQWEYQKIEYIARNDAEFEKIIGGTMASILGCQE